MSPAPPTAQTHGRTPTRFFGLAAAREIRSVGWSVPGAGGFFSASRAGMGGGSDSGA